MNQKKKIKDKKCKECGNTFTPFQPLQSVCSKSCEIKYKAKKKASKNVSPPKKTSIAPMSKKAKAENAIYMPIRNEYMKEHAYCECGCGREATQNHHRAGRIGYYDQESKDKGLKLLWDKRFFMATHWECHRRIHDNSDWAYEKEYLLKSKM
jgi:hypothetical protein